MTRIEKANASEHGPQVEYTDPEHGNWMFFWDFGKKSEKGSSPCLMATPRG